MKTDTITQAFDPEAPLAIPLSVIRRFFLGSAVVLVSLFVVWASMGSMAQPAPNPGITKDGWHRYKAPSFAFSYPTAWAVNAPGQGDATSYRLAPQADAGTGTHVAIAYLPTTTTNLDQIERLGVAHVERDDTIARHYLRIMTPTRLADRVAARVRFTADLVSGERVEGLWVGIPQEDGQVLSFVLNVYPDDYFNGVHHTFKRLLASITLGD